MCKCNNNCSCSANNKKAFVEKYTELKNKIESCVVRDRCQLTDCYDCTKYTNKITLVEANNRIISWGDFD